MNYRPGIFLHLDLMKKYTHYSFDLWLTLIKSDPTFKLERDKYFFEKFNRKHLSLPEVSKIIREVDVTCNSVNEIAGGSISPMQMYVMILKKMDYPINTLSGNDMVAIYHYIEGIFLEHPPKPFSPETIPTLLKLRENGATLSILSNTGFILGDTIDRMFDQHFKIHVPGLSLNHIFSFRLYSDRLNASKPSKAAFQMMTDIVSRQKPMTQPDQIVHVGDSLAADAAGAIAAGIDSYIINSNNNLIQDLLNY